MLKALYDKFNNKDGSFHVITYFCYILGNYDRVGLTTETRTMYKNRNT